MAEAERRTSVPAEATSVHEFRQLDPRVRSFMLAAYSARSIPIPAPIPAEADAVVVAAGSTDVPRATVVELHTQDADAGGATSGIPVHEPIPAEADAVVVAAGSTEVPLATVVELRTQDSDASDAASSDGEAGNSAPSELPLDPASDVPAPSPQAERASDASSPIDGVTALPAVDTEQPTRRASAPEAARAQRNLCADEPRSEPELQPSAPPDEDRQPHAPTEGEGTATVSQTPEDGWLSREQAEPETHRSVERLPDGPANAGEADGQPRRVPAARTDGRRGQYVGYSELLAIHRGRIEALEQRCEQLQAERDQLASELLREREWSHTSRASFETDTRRLGEFTTVVRERLTRVEDQLSAADRERQAAERRADAWMEACRAARRDLEANQFATDAQCAEAERRAARAAVLASELSAELQARAAEVEALLAALACAERMLACAALGDGRALQAAAEQAAVELHSEHAQRLAALARRAAERSEHDALQQQVTPRAVRAADGE